MAVLAATARLAHELVFLLPPLANRLAIGNLRLTHIGLDPELALHAIDDDIEVQLAHPRNDRLAGLLVRMDAERRVFLGQLLQRDAHLILVSLRLRLDRHGNNRLRKLHALERDLVFQIAQRVTCGDVLEANRGGDIAGADFLDLFAIVRVHLQYAADALFLALDRVEYRVARVQTPEYTRKNVRLPTNGSVAILNASAANGSSSSAGRAASVSSSTCP